MSRLDGQALDVLFREARTHFVWQQRAVSDELLQELFELVKMGPTSANCSPLRVVFIRGEENTGNETAFRNSTLQGGYFMLAARALGLDCGPMSGFDKAALDREFFPEGRFRSNFLCNLGYGVHDKLHPRLPRFDFNQVCRIL